MKKYSIALMAALLMSIGVFGQEEGTETEQDTLKVQVGGKSIAIIDEGSADFDDEDDYEYDDRFSYWGGIDIGVNMLVNSDGDFDRTDENKWLELDPTKSLSVGVNLIEHKIKLVQNHVGLVTGLGLVYNSYGLADSVSIEPKTFDGKDSTFAIYSQEPGFDKNKFRTTHLRVPLILEINTSKDEDRNIHIAGGVQGGWRIGAINKQEFDLDNGEEVKVRRKNDFNTRDFTLDATARVGYRGFTLFATYGLTSLFEDDKGPEVYPVTVGITIVNF